jgi:aryl-alcohol dehydrogenase
VSVDSLRPDEVLIEIAGTGLCHTDLAVRDGLYEVPFPVVLGHEGAGTIRELGSDVDGFRVGDRVIASFSSCGPCSACRSGHPAYCVDAFERNFGAHRADGSTTLFDGDGAIASPFFGQSAFAEIAIVRAADVVPVPADLPIELLGSLGCGLQTGAGAVLNVLRLRPGDSLAVFGTGAVGLAAVMAARAIGVEAIIGVDRVPARLEIGRALGLKETIAARDDVARAIVETTGGGVTASIDTTGSPVVLRNAVESLAPRGRCVLLGASRLGTEVTLDMGSLLFGRSLQGVIEGDCVPAVTIPALLDLYRDGRFDIDVLCTTFPMCDVEIAAEASLAGEVIKPVLVP